MKNVIRKVSLVLIMMLGACSEDLLNKQNPNGSTPDRYYTNEIELTTGVNGIYAMVQSGRLTGREWFFLHDLRSDDVATGGGQLEGARNQILTGSLQTSNGVMTDVWKGYYRTIHRANSVIDGSVNTQNITDERKNRLLGEARFLRAWAYSELVAFWGAVPLYKNTVQSLLESEARTPVDEVYQFIIEELKAIQAVLPASYSGADVGRVTKGAAQALLGRVLMTTGDYAGAKTELEKVKDSGLYALVANYSDNFKEETGFNKESIFEIGFQNDGFNWDYDGNGTGNEGNSRTQEYSAIGWRNLIPSDALLADYERTSKGDAKNDPRFSDTFYRIGDKFNNDATTLTDVLVQGNLSNFEGGKEKISWKKYTSMYKNNLTFYTGPMNMRIIRYAEVLLMLAECENEVGTSTAAIGYLNEIRSRASVNMPDYPTTNYPVNSKAEIFRAIQHEKRVELAGEQIRNRDILRWRKQGKLTSEPISYFQANKYELLPIPQEEFSTNASLKPTDQNPGY
ncbi:RagB/SusD family nutrient uptake outer membrane protein [Cytophagaceae bacterium DM2B3-1]|uniref:RagB/SusD family nutrient uptake outer membrane protein n=1 Tax=Xanthocytophaga flava TaxID=3048013 RepID=A0ABT7CDT1_9BACT|nr:RagB/SusD family nutrient uptake outer membrane protein [Xanthocytophaga flavus]MDJ1472702.1 RagB/SusD family nutrient uptake outer membrane protein [Xanthocytophaga flavus]MDJ1491882.1 RagB/SusD family nutrient uptake outer membrane protein [Xanthocytophaga flavus]